MSAAQKQLYEQQKGKLQTRLTAAKAKVAAAVADPANVDTAGLAAANKEISDIDSQLDRISTVGTGQPSGGAPSAPGSHPGAPAVGSVVSGYRFKGGNPNDKNNWTPE